MTTMHIRTTSVIARYSRRGTLADDGTPDAWDSRVVHAVDGQAARYRGYVDVARLASLFGGLV